MNVLVIAAVSGTKRGGGHAPVWRGHYFPYELVDVLLALIHCVCLAVLLLILITIIRAIVAASRLPEQPARRTVKCAECGYDLRATPDPAGTMKSRCCECGHINPLPARRAHLHRGFFVGARRGRKCV